MLITGIVLTGHNIRDLGVLQGLSIIVLHNIHLCEIVLSLYIVQKRAKYVNTCQLAARCITPVIHQNTMSIQINIKTIN